MPKLEALESMSMEASELDPVETSPDDELSDDFKRLLFGLLFGLTSIFVVVVAFGICCGPLVEFQRLTPFEAVSVLFVDVMALVWLIVCFARHCLVGEPFESVNLQTPGATRLLNIAIASLIAALLFNGWHIWRIYRGEEEAFRGAVRTQGTMVVVRLHGGEQAHYRVRIRFQDKVGNSYESKQLLRDPQDLTKLPPAIAQAVRNLRQAPLAVDVSFDESWPQKCWLNDVGIGGGSLFAPMMGLVLMIQSLVGWIFLKRLEEAKQKYGKLAWFYDLHGAVLLCAGLGMLAFVTALMSILTYLYPGEFG